MQLITVAPNCERQVSALLAARKFEFYAFRTGRRTARRGQLRETLVPAFPRYIFVDAKHRWEDVRSISHVGDFVRFNGQICEVRQCVIDDLVDRADANGVIQFPEPPPRFRPGTSVVVSSNSNPLFGSRGVFAHDLGGRAIVLLPWFNGQMVSTLVDANDIDLFALSQQRGKRRRNRRRRSGTSRPGAALQ